MQYLPNSGRELTHILQLFGFPKMQPARQFQLCFTLRLGSERNGDVMPVGASFVLMALADM